MHWPKVGEIVIFKFSFHTRKNPSEVLENKTFLLLSLVQKTCICSSSFHAPQGMCLCQPQTVVSTLSVTEVSSSCAAATICACGRRIRSAEDRIHCDLCISFSSILTLLSTAHLNIAPVISIIFSSPAKQNHTLHLQQSRSFSRLYSLYTF